MKRTDNDVIFQELARRYADACGRQMLSQRQDMQRQGAIYVTPRADARARALAGRRKRGRAWALSAAAAVLVIVSLSALVPRAIQKYAPQDGTVQQDETGPAKGQPDTAGTAILPLAFRLPGRFEVAGAELDNGQSVYRLTDLYGYGDVVLTMEAGGNIQAYGDLGTVYVGELSARALEAEGYNLIVFEHGGLLYTLSNRGDMAELTELLIAIVA